MLGGAVLGGEPNMETVAPEAGMAFQSIYFETWLAAFFPSSFLGHWFGGGRQWGRMVSMCFKKKTRSHYIGLNGLELDL